MSRMRTIALALLVCCVLFIGACGTPPRLLGHGGFEPESTRPKSKDDWYPVPVRPETQEYVEFEWEDEVVYDGERSVSIAIDPEHPTDEISYNWTKVVHDCEWGRTYELSGWIKAENLSDTAWIVTQCWGEDPHEMLGFSTTQKHHPVTETTDWTPVWTVFTVPEETDEVRIRAGISTPANRGGRVWFDDIHVREFDPPTATGGLGLVAGSWAGTLSAGADLRLVVNVEPSVNGWRITLDSVDQGVNGLGVDNLTIDGDRVRFELERLGASYAGTLVDADHLEGTWKQGIELPLNFERTDDVPRVTRPQEPKPPFPYAAEDVAYTFDPHDIPATLAPTTGADDDALVTLQGTLTLPPGDGPHPAVLLITGSGPQDRDESLMNHKPFWVLADHLSRRGLAVLRVDDRGTGESTGDFSQATTADFARDAAAGFLFLQQRDDIAADRVALLGHSEGGLIAPMVAVEYPGVAAIVLMAGPGVDGRAILRLQQRLMLEAQGVPADRLNRFQEQQAAIFDILCGDLSKTEVSAGLDVHLAAIYETLSAAAQSAVGSRDAYIESGKAQMDTPWMRGFLAYDPAPTLSRVTCPVLALNGAKDMQVDPGQNLLAIEAALKSGATEDHTILEFPQLNHLFQHCETGVVAEYAQIEETLAPEFLEAVAQWLRDRLAAAQK